MVAQLVSALELAVVVELFLDGVVGQVDVAVVDVFDVELSAAGAQVALLVPVTLEVSVNSAHHRKDSDVELPALVQKRLLNVFLNYVTPTVAAQVHVLDQALNLVQVLHNCNAAPAVCVFSGLNDPKVLAELRILVEHSLTALTGIVEYVLELQKLWVAEAFLDVEGEREEVVVLDS